MQPTLIDQGLNLMLFGMGTVFVFLTVLVFATILMSRLVSRFGSSAELAIAGEAPKPTTQPSTQPSPQVMEAIRQAIAQHRKA